MGVECMVMYRGRHAPREGGDVGPFHCRVRGFPFAPYERALAVFSVATRRQLPVLITPPG